MKWARGDDDDAQLQQTRPAGNDRGRGLLTYTRADYVQKRALISFIKLLLSPAYLKPT
jgi:hypothetical protein